MSDLTEQEKRLLALMERAEAADDAAEAAQPPPEGLPRPLPERFTSVIGADDEGRLFPPRPSAPEEQSAYYEHLINVMEEQERVRAQDPPAGEPADRAVPGGGAPPRDRDR